MRPRLYWIGSLVGRRSRHPAISAPHHTHARTHTHTHTHTHTRTRVHIPSIARLLGAESTAARVSAADRIFRSATASESPSSCSARPPSSRRRPSTPRTVPTVLRVPSWPQRLRRPPARRQRRRQRRACEGRRCRCCPRDARQSVSSTLERGSGATRPMENTTARTAGRCGRANAVPPSTVVPALCP